jgi:hypothetical protein
MPTTTRRPDALAELRAEMADLRLRVAEMADLGRRVARLEAQAPPSRESLTANLLAAIDAAWGADTFLAEHLLGDANFRYILVGRSCRSIGKLLARSRGKTFGGLRLVDRGRVDGLCRWSVERVT